jgi:hypothetical protein
MRRKGKTRTPPARVADNNIYKLKATEGKRQRPKNILGHFVDVSSPGFNNLAVLDSSPGDSRPRSRLPRRSEACSLPGVMISEQEISVRGKLRPKEGPEQRAKEFTSL